MDDPELAALRVEYPSQGLEPELLGDDPMAAFLTWFEAARASDASRAEIEANAMALATTAPDGTPSVRMVLLKHVDEQHAGFTWFTNVESRKAREAHATGRAALCWWWPGAVPRQVRAVGGVEPVDRQTSATYFTTRPVAAQAGAAASHQSRAVASRSMFEAR
ncbi:MAG: Pyridoxine/pyridoxamine 5-phosphate oxidase, partial [Thermoleophilia bacterium]|nr:Pyridoxine/pyridoxamine 5-phosphate oxidase [Thermoleophilia bacterium]